MLRLRLAARDPSRERVLRECGERQFAGHDLIAPSVRGEAFEVFAYDRLRLDVMVGPERERRVARESAAASEEERLVRPGKHRRESSALVGAKIARMAEVFIE